MSRKFREWKKLVHAYNWFFNYPNYKPTFRKYKQRRRLEQKYIKKGELYKIGYNPFSLSEIHSITNKNKKRM